MEPISSDPVDGGVTAVPRPLTAGLRRSAGSLEIVGMDQSNSAIEMVDPDEIIVGERRRGLNRDTVDELKVSIARIGLKTPISVREHGGRLILAKNI
jgi:hypothetical protein